MPPSLPPPARWPSSQRAVMGPSRLAQEVDTCPGSSCAAACEGGPWGSHGGHMGGRVQPMHDLEAAVWGPLRCVSQVSELPCCAQNKTLT